MAVWKLWNLTRLSNWIQLEVAVWQFSLKTSDENILKKKILIQETYPCCQHKKKNYLKKKKKTCYKLFWGYKKTFVSFHEKMFIYVKAKHFFPLKQITTKLYELFVRNLIEFCIKILVIIYICINECSCLQYFFLSILFIELLRSICMHPLCRTHIRGIYVKYVYLITIKKRCKIYIQWMNWVYF